MLSICIPIWLFVPLPESSVAVLVQQFNPLLHRQWCSSSSGSGFGAAIVCAATQSVNAAGAAANAVRAL